ncbi:hypothetical protein BKA69DRAFT_1099035 [Paraphysoderma sedebokerense]|nr:hypothetical protein BKA69DRAFT_1099035 [Paraphysoderma sedebokerense]
MFSLFSSRQDVFVCNADTLLGYYAAISLCESKEFNKIICGVCDKEDEWAKKLEKEGCELREWNLDDRRSIEMAMHGMKHVLLLAPHNEKIMQQTCNMLEACRSVDVKHMVYWSLLGVDLAHGEEYKRLKEWKKVEDMVKQCGIHNLCIARIGFAQQKLFMLSHIIQDRGILPLPTGRGKWAPVNLRDCGLATAKIFCKAESQTHHKHQIYNFTGVHLMTGRKLVEHANRVLQSEIEFHDIHMEEFKKILMEMEEMNEFEIESILECMCLIRENKLAIRTEDLKKLLDREPTDIETFFKHNADSFRPGGGRLRRLAIKDHL